jgi:hypothetical protein
MTDISDIREKIEKVRKEVGASLEQEPYEVAYARNQELDRLIEQYLDAVGETATDPHQSPPPDTTSK